MSTSIDALFGATSAATAKWKPISASAAAAAAEGSWKPVAATPAKAASAGDSVEVTGLAKSLTGVAGKVFAALGSKARAMLDGFVKSGQMTADEVALGLRSLATDAVRGRFMQERAYDEEDKAWAEKGATAEKAFRRKMDRMNALIGGMEGERMAAHAAFEADGDQEAFQARMQPVNERFRAEAAAIDKEERDAVGGDPNEVRTATMNHFLKKGMTEFAKLGLDQEEGGLLKQNDEKGKAAADKLFDLGFMPKTFRNGLAQFAADFDIPGIGRGTVGPMLPDSDPSAAEEAAATGTAAPIAAEAAAGPGVKSFATVSEEARTALDSSLASLARTGKPANLSDPQQADALFGAFDRRSLFAVASNSGGKFSKEEQKAARSVMARQQEGAMKAADPTGSNPAAAYRAGVLFLDQASEEEKASAGWSVQRAAAQFGYESAMRRQGAAPDRLESGSELVRMLKGALDTSRDMEAKGQSGADYVQTLLKMPAFRDGVPDLNEYLKNAVSLKV